MSLNTSKRKSFFYVSIIFVLLLIQLANNIPKIDDFSPWCSTPYLLSYQQYGFCSRFFIGSLLELVGINHSQTNIYLVVLFVQFLLILLLCYMINKMFNYSFTFGFQDNALILLVTYLLSPGSVSYLFQKGNYGRFDAILMISMLLCIALSNCLRAKWLIPIICMISMSIHQGFFVLFAPMICIILFFNAINHKSKMEMYLLVLTALCSLVSFIIFQFFAKTPILDYKSLIASLKNNSDFAISEMMIYFEYYINLSTFIKQLVPNIGKLLKLFMYLILTTLLLVPLFFIFIRFWLLCIKHSTNKMKNAIYTLIMFLPLMASPIFIVGIDYGRWFGAIITCQFTCLGYLICYDENVRYVYNIYLKVLKNKWRCLMLLLMYFSLIGNVTVGSLEVIDHVVLTVKNVLNVISSLNII